MVVLSPLFYCLELFRLMLVPYSVSCYIQTCILECIYGRIFLVSSGTRIGRMVMIRIIGIRNKKKKRSFQKWTEKLTMDFFPRLGGKISIGADACYFSQPFCYCQVIDNFFILFILPQIAEYMEWHKLPF